MCLGSGCSLLKSQYTGQVGGKERLLYFICQQLAGEVAAICSKANVHPHDKQVVSFIDKVGGGLHAEIVHAEKVGGGLHSNWS